MLNNFGLNEKAIKAAEKMIEADLLETRRMWGIPDSADPDSSFIERKLTDAETSQDTPEEESH